MKNFFEKISRLWRVPRVKCSLCSELIYGRRHLDEHRKLCNKSNPAKKSQEMNER